MPTLATFIQHNIGSPCQRNQKMNKNQIQTGKEEVKMSLFAGDIILYTGNPKEYSKEHLKLLSKFNK